MFYGQLVTGRTPRRRPTAEQRLLAEQWLAQTGRAVTTAAVAELAPHVRVTGKPEPHEVQAFARLVRRGQVPTAGAVQGEMASRSAGVARRRQLEKTRAATVEDLTGTGAAAAAYVRGYRERTGHGPELGRAAAPCRLAAGGHRQPDAAVARRRLAGLRRRARLAATRPSRRAAAGGGRVAGDRRSGGRRHRDVAPSGTSAPGLAHGCCRAAALPDRSCSAASGATSPVGAAHPHRARTFAVPLSDAGIHLREVLTSALRVVSGRTDVMPVTEQPAAPAVEPPRPRKASDMLLSWATVVGP